MAMSATQHSTGTAEASTFSSNPSRDQKDKKMSLASAITKALTANSDWTGEKDELLDALYWGRQLLSLAIGVVWGLIPLKGAVAILLYIIASTLAGYCYVTKFQADEEIYGGFMELSKEGFGAAFATFLVSWIAVYSAMHY